MVVARLLAALLLFVVAVSAQERGGWLVVGKRPDTTVYVPPTTSDPTTQPLVQQVNMDYVGAFRLPADAAMTGGTFSGGGEAISYYAPRNSLYVSTFRAADYVTRMAEVGIPTVTTSGSVAGLNTASKLQDFIDPTEGHLNDIDPNTNKYVILSSSLPYNGKLVIGGYVFYDNSNSAYLSHFTRDLDFSVAGHGGPYSIAYHYQGFVGAYMANVPAEWQALFGMPAVTGNCCDSIVSRTSYGLSLFGFNPGDLGVHEPTIGNDFFYYTAAHEMPGAVDNMQNNVWNLATQVTGVVFPTGTRSVLFFGRHGTGPYCYDEAVICGDTTVTSRGPHAPPYREQVWAYDANDLVRAKNGGMNFYDVAPYAIWDMALPFTSTKLLLGAAYDPATQRVFVSQDYSDNTHPIIHVFHINNASSPASPSSSGTRIPTAVSIVDASGGTWTLGTGTAPNIQILKNGSQVASTTGAQILWLNSFIYVQESDLNWYAWNGTAFTLIGPNDPETGNAPRCVMNNCPVVANGFGYGMSTRAAYGCGSNPSILHVTTLADSGTGSLRAALTASGPRVVVFDRSGDIPLASGISITNPCITVAGQTAPSPGITVRYGYLHVGTHDVLLQHLRWRMGVQTITCNDAVGIYPSGVAQNIVFDHMSISWGIDENLLAYGGLSGGDLNFTVWRSITSESINYTSDAGGNCNGAVEAGHGFLVTQQTTKVAMIQSLTAHNNERNPYIQNGSSIAILNNIIYDWYKEWGIVFGSHSTISGGAWAGTVIGNRFKRGLDTVDPNNGNQAWMFYYLLDSNPPGFNITGNAIYRSDNTLDDGSGALSGHIVTQANQLPYDPNVGSPPAGAPVPTGYAPMSSTAVEGYVLPRVGARPLDRDSVDARVAADVTNRTGHMPASQNDVGGFPTLAVNVVVFVPVANPHTVSASGYTNLEVQLHNAAAAIEP